MEHPPSYHTMPPILLQIMHWMNRFYHHKDDCPLTATEVPLGRSKEHEKRLRLGSCIPNVYPAECSPAAGDAHWTPPASSSILLKRENAVADKTDVMVPDSSMLTALLASGGAMTTSTDNAVFTFSHANTMESGSDNGHSTARARNAVDLYKHHGLSRLRKRGMRPIGMVPNGMVSNYGSAYTPSETPKKSVPVFFAVTLIAALTLKCWGSCHHASDVEPPGPAMGYPVIAPIMTAQLRNQADQIDLAVMPLSPIRPDISTLVSHRLVVLLVTVVVVVGV
ncbi:hypothetical protein SeLEV6574_g04135 [Synchytrium endobioticum]|uniref:Uncharacterized protein n=1 Tax=Synchytrium endobioticum TaxID=286115 RepID=A0A507D1D2_9FUNG|nr:hypothetical protein SeLEV6574_g04135 [Synchytrium endobioticum]